MDEGDHAVRVVWHGELPAKVHVVERKGDLHR